MNGMCDGCNRWSVHYEYFLNGHRYEVCRWCYDDPRVRDRIQKEREKEGT